MKVSEIICESGIDQHLAPELLQQQVNQIIDAIKAGGYLLTDSDKALLDYARKQKIYHPDEIANNKFHTSIIASVKPLLKKIEQLWTEPRDITSDVEAIMDEPVPTGSQKIKQLLANPNRQPIDNVMRKQLTQLLVAAACPKNNGTWYSSTAKCYSNNYPWILDQDIKKIHANQKARRNDQREKVRAYNREWKRNFVANMTPAEREEYRAHNREWQRRFQANMTPAKKEEYLAKKREREQEQYQRRKAKKK